MNMNMNMNTITNCLSLQLFYSDLSFLALLCASAYATFSPLTWMEIYMSSSALSVNLTSSPQLALLAFPFILVTKLSNFDFLL